MCTALESPESSSQAQLRRLSDTLVQIRDRFRAIPADYERGRLLIGIQGEIFCRMEEFSNGHLVRHPEACGAEAWLSDISEWILYSNSAEEQHLRHEGRRYSLAMMKARLRDGVQRFDQHALQRLFAEDFQGYEEFEDSGDLLHAGYPYLPYTGTEGKMVLSVGKVEHFFRGGVDGIIDVSPISCMNGVVSEAIYPRLIQDHAGLPIKNVYVDGTGRDLISELEIFLELARTYQRNKPHPCCHSAMCCKRLCASVAEEETGLAPTFSVAS
jgi:predicted nucleotide-binding protein (sugar kinase/HSP70/actin superfamily)